jgi:anti-sigma factor RsiW
MADPDCTEVELLLQADLDGELDIAGSATVAAHLARCASCARRQTALASLMARLRAAPLSHPAPAHLRQAVLNTLEAARVPAAPATPEGSRLGSWLDNVRTGVWSAVSLGAGAALATAVMVAVVLPRAGGLPDSVVASHIRALQPGHLTDVISTDQHTVKPWFDGRLDYAPPVKDLAAQGFPLAGGRLDYLNNRPVAALIYRRGQHVIDLYVWPETNRPLGSGGGERNGYNYERWLQGGMEFWAVSDVALPDLRQFVQTWRDAPLAANDRS